MRKAPVRPEPLCLYFYDSGLGWENRQRGGSGKVFGCCGLGGFSQGVGVDTDSLVGLQDRGSYMSGLQPLEYLGFVSQGFALGSIDK